MSERVVLPEATRRAAARGFVRVPLPRAVPTPDGASADSALVGPCARGLVAFLNLCRHQAVPLDLVRGEPTPGPGAPPEPAPVADDGVHLVCLRHGARFRPRDGACTAGPCLGERLHALEVTAEDGVVALVLPAEIAGARSGERH